MAVDHILYQGKKWWQADERPLIGKIATSIQPVLYYKLTGTSFTVDSSIPAQNIKNTQVIGQAKDSTLGMMFEAWSGYWYQAKYFNFTVNGGVHSLLIVAVLSPRKEIAWC